MNPSRATPSSVNTAFVGSIPQAYDTYLGPFLFEKTAEDLARRVSGAVASTAKVLEVACGTGISTRHLSGALPQARIIATDLNEAMVAYAKEHAAAGGNVIFDQADALALPFEDDVFDAVVCQFGVMFFPDKEKGLTEMCRVLKPGGVMYFNVWDSVKANPYVSFALDTIAEFFDTDPPRFLEIPYGYNDTGVIRALIESAGLKDYEVSVVSANVRQTDATATADRIICATCSANPPRRA